MGRGEQESSIVSLSAVVIRPAATLSVMFLVYGFYILLFILCLYVLVISPRKSRANKLYLWSTIFLFFAGTINVVFYTHEMVRQTSIYFMSLKNDDDGPLSIYLRGDGIRTMDDTMTSCVSVVTNILADAMLIHRCYLVWGYRKRVAIPLIIAALASNLIGLTSFILLTASSIERAINRTVGADHWSWRFYLRGTDLRLGYLGVAAGVNSIITLLTAWRIWWSTKEARKLMAAGIRGFYRRVVSIVLESGVLYPIFIIVHISLTQNSEKIGVPITLYPTIPLIAGIAPALILVRASLGSNRKNLSRKFSSEREAVDHEITTLQFAPVMTQSSSSGPISTTVGSTSSEDDRGAEAKNDQMSFTPRSAV